MRSLAFAFKRSGQLQPSNLTHSSDHLASKAAQHGSRVRFQLIFQPNGSLSRDAHFSWLQTHRHCNERFALRYT